MISFKNFFVNPKWNFGIDHFNLAAAVGYSFGASKALNNLHSTVAAYEQPAKEVNVSVAAIPAFRGSTQRCNVIFRFATQFKDLQTFIVPETLLLSTAETNKWSKPLVCYDVTRNSTINDFTKANQIRGEFKRAPNGDLMIRLLMIDGDNYIITCPYKILEHVQKLGKTMYQLKEMTASDLLKFAKDHKLKDVMQPSDVAVAAHNLVEILK